MNSKNFYITTTLPYVNSDPHIGFAMEAVRADVIARHKELLGFEVFSNTGTDEHGQKIYDNAEKEGASAQEYVDGYAESFKELKNVLNLKEDTVFIRTTDKKHVAAAQEMWKRCEANGYIYKKDYQTKYCVGCELSKTDSELDNGQCAIHPTYEIQMIDEENYFFKFSAFQEKLSDFYDANPDFVTPDFRFNEIKAFVKNGLHDFSISRLKEKMSWGVPVPGDDSHVMYVWFDALTNYISTLDWPNEDADGNFEKFWKQGTPVQYCGKDNLRQQSAMWQAMLMAADLPNSKKIVINGFIMAEDGQKMSKSIGNVINPLEIIEKYKEFTAYPADVIRYYVTRHLHPFEDSNAGFEKLKEAYTANLVNGLGNLTSRLMNMVVSYGVEYDVNDLWIEKDYTATEGSRCKAYFDHIENFQLQKTMDSIFSRVNSLDEEITKKEPFKKIKIEGMEEEVKGDLRKMVIAFSKIAKELQIFMPETADKLKEILREKKKPEAPLFSRIG